MTNYDLSFAYNVLSKYQSTLIADCSRGPLTFQITYTYDIWCPMPFQPKYTIKNLDQLIIEAKTNNNFVKTLLVKSLKGLPKIYHFSLIHQIITPVQHHIWFFFFCLSLGLDFPFLQNVFSEGFMEEQLIPLGFFSPTGKHHFQLSITVCPIQHTELFYNYIFSWYII